MVGNYVRDKANDKDLDLASVLYSNSENKHVQNVENAEMKKDEGSEFFLESNCGIHTETTDGRVVTKCNSIEEFCEGVSKQDESHDKEEKVMEEQDSDEEDSNKCNKENMDATHKSNYILKKSIDSKQKSKSQLKKERMKIHSETHRLMREREISIPYHVPKKRTLKEFFARKKYRAHVPLNMPRNQLLEVMKEIEEGTGSHLDFFKSDSELDEESCDTNEKHDEVMEKIVKNENSTKENLDISDSSNINNNNNNNDNDNVNNDDVANNCNTIVTANDKNETLNSILTNGKWESQNGNGLNLVTDNDHNTLFMSEDTVMEVNDLADGKDKCSIITQFAGIIHREENYSSSSDDGSNLVLDLNCAQSENPEVENNTEQQDEKYTRQRTSEWVNNIPIYEKSMKRPNKKEILLQTLNPKLLTIVPKLSGEPDSFIDLETDKNSIAVGAKNLKKRFIENCIAPRNKPKTEVELSVTTSERDETGEIRKVTTEKLIYTTTEVLKDLDHEKPGAKIQRLREELKKKIEAKWEEENRKKMEEMRIEMEKKKGVGGEDEVEDEEELIDDYEMEESDDMEESEPEENDIPLVEKKEKKSHFIDEEAEESDCDEESGNEGGDELDDDDEDRDDTVNDSCHATEEHSNTPATDGFHGNEYSDSQSSLIPPYQPGGGMLHGGSELTQNDEDISLPRNVLSPALRLSLDLSSTTKNVCSQQHWDIDLGSPEESNTRSNFVPRFPENKNFDLNDAYEFCSGKFPGEGDENRDFRPDETSSQEFFITPGSESQLSSNDFHSLRVTECQEPDDETENGKKKRSRLKILSDVSEDDIDQALDDLSELEDITKGRLSSDSSSEKSLHIRKRGRRKNLVFSDEDDDPEVERKFRDEREEEDELHDEEGSSQNGEDVLTDEEVREVEYDSEEAEIVNPVEYFEKEAELSGSEWSRDEDERDLDQFEVEDGDDDKLDEKKVRSELEKIHMRTLLDDDAREVRLLQEILFEDGDLFDDGPKREKNFRWKDLEGTFFDDNGNDGDNPGKFQGHEDLEEDEETRKIRHEKELFLLQMKSKREEMEIDDDKNGTPLLKSRKIIIKKSSLTATTTKNVSTTLRTEVDDINLKTPFAPTNNRASFLLRPEEFLARLAKSTASATENILGPKHSKNFIFIAKEREKEVESSKENSHPKRKGSSVKDDHLRNKKAKLDEAPKISVLDRLT